MSISGEFVITLYKWLYGVVYHHAYLSFTRIKVVNTARMTKRADCFDNAALESWNHHFKIDAIHGEKCVRIHRDVRLHSTIGYKTPESFEVLSKVCDFPGQDHLVNHRKHALLIYQVSDEFDLKDKIIYSLLEFFASIQLHN